MKKHITTTVFIILVSIFNQLPAQELKFANITTTELSKEAKDGRYGGTYLNDGKADVIFVYSTKKEGTKFETYSFDDGMQFNSVKSDALNDESGKDFTWYLTEEDAEVMAPSDTKWIQTGRTFGGAMKFWLGTMKKQYYLGIFTDIAFEEEDELKVKTGDVWRLYASGYKSTTKFDAVDATDGFSYDLKKYGDNILAPASDPILAAGVIQEKVRIKEPTLYANNRIAIISVTGADFDNPKYNIYIHPYSAMNMASGLGQDDNLCSLFAPLYAPTKGVGGALDYLLWKDRKDVFNMYRFSDNYELIDSVSFNSKLMWGDFEIKNGMGSTFIIGKGKKDFDGWARNGSMPVKNIDGIQVTKIKDGKVLYSTLFDEDEMVGKLSGPMGMKVKFNMPVANNQTLEILPLFNGDDLIIGRSPTETYMFQMSEQGELKAYFQIPAINEKEDRIYNHQLLVKGDFVYLVLNEQPIGMSNETQVKSESTTVKGAYVTTTYTKTTVTRLNEVYLRSQLVRLNIQSAKLSNSLVMDGKNFYPMGTFPALITQDAIYFTGNDKGPGGKTISVARVDL